MFGDLVDFLERAMLDKARVKVIARDGETFTGISGGMDEGDDDHLGWAFSDVQGSPYDYIFLKDIASVNRLDTSDAYAASN